jgi:hypothetical protein
MARHDPTQQSLSWAQSTAELTGAAIQPQEPPSHEPLMQSSPLPQLAPAVRPTQLPTAAVHRPLQQSEPEWQVTCPKEGMQPHTPASAHVVQHAPPDGPLHAVPGAPQQNVVSAPPAHVCPAGQVLSRQPGSQPPTQFTSHAKETPTRAAFLCHSPMRPDGAR